MSSRRTVRKAARRGFTLLEVLVALAILGLALAAIAGINANSFEESNYSRFVTVATLLARSKMIDVEEQLRKDGLGDSDKDFSGDFSDEGYPSVKWTATCRKVEIDVSQLLGGLLGGEVSSEALPDAMQGFLGSLQGGPAGPSGASGPAGSLGLGTPPGGGGPSELAKMMAGGGLEIIFKQVSETLANSIREITLEITWGGKKDAESIKFVEYVTTTGRLAMPQGVASVPQGQAIDPMTGQPYPPGQNPMQQLQNQLPNQQFVPPGQQPGDRNSRTLQTGPIPGVHMGPGGIVGGK